jgi:hypothetical protein
MPLDQVEVTTNTLTHLDAAINSIDDRLSMIQTQITEYGAERQEDLNEES